MNKQFLKGVAALFAVAVLGVSCQKSPADPNGNDEGSKLDFVKPSLTTGGVYGTPIAVSALTKTQPTDVTVSFRLDNAIQEPKVSFVSAKEVSEEDGTDVSRGVTLAATDITATSINSTSVITFTVSGAKSAALSEKLMKFEFSVSSKTHKTGTVTAFVKFPEAQNVVITKAKIEQAFTSACNGADGEGLVVGTATYRNTPIKVQIGSGKASVGSAAASTTLTITVMAGDLDASTVSLVALAGSINALIADGVH